jgi:putative restriction endonuclease
VNFWRPGGSRTFGALEQGEPFLFKTHYPHNQVVGGGFYSGFEALTVSEAWDFFGEENGVEDLQQMRSRVGRYRAQPIAPQEDPFIGCVFIRDARFFAPDDVVGPPPDFAPNIVQGKTYDLAASSGTSYFERILARLLAAPAEPQAASPWHRPGPVYGDPRLTPYRLGQNTFKAKVLAAYSRRCSITGDKIKPVLQAAHIRPLPAGGEHRLDNGLLLRSDVHTLFDRGYLGIDPRYRLLVSRRLREEFGNGEQFYSRAGQTINLPQRRHDRPNPEFLEWHADEVFQAS